MSMLRLPADGHRLAMGLRGRVEPGHHVKRTGEFYGRSFPTTKRTVEIQTDAGPSQRARVRANQRAARAARRREIRRFQAQTYIKPWKREPVWSPCSRRWRIRYGLPI